MLEILYPWAQQDALTYGNKDFWTDTDHQSVQYGTDLVPYRYTVQADISICVLVK